MQRRALFLIAALGLVAASLSRPTTATDLQLQQPGSPNFLASSCEECRANCNLIPMDTADCIQLYCPECADASASPGVEEDGVGVDRSERP